jgi:NADH-quinone oxidoreductase subunit E
MLRGLELMSEYYTLGFDRKPLNTQFKKLEKEAIEYGKLKKIEKKDEALKTLLQELREIDEIIDSYNAEKNALIQILLQIQARYHWLPKHALWWISKRLNVPLTQIHHIATFYKAFSLTPQGRHHVHVCIGTACHVRGAPRLLERTVEVLGIKPGETDSELRFTLQTVGCLGCCALGPVIKVDNDYHSNPTTEQMRELFENLK